MTHELAPGAETPPRPERAPGPPPPARGRTHYWATLVKAGSMAYLEGVEAGYRLAISDLESWLATATPAPELIPGIEKAVDKLSIRADDYWPQEEIT